MLDLAVLKEAAQRGTAKTLLSRTARFGIKIGCCPGSGVWLGWEYAVRLGARNTTTCSTSNRDRASLIDSVDERHKFNSSDLSSREKHSAVFQTTISIMSLPNGASPAMMAAMKTRAASFPRSSSHAISTHSKGGEQESLVDFGHFLGTLFGQFPV